VKHAGLAGKAVIAHAKVYHFDADGVAEVDAVDADYLLTIPGYTPA
jgi:hypothetical protein